MKPLLRLPPGEGRTFVCGDIHGSFTCVERALNELNFDTSKDRLICAGDIVDRGPESELCLELLYEDWFFCCMGNHEHMMLEYFLQLPYGAYWAMNGGSWGTKYVQWAHIWENSVENTEEFKAKAKRIEETVLTKVKELPYLITVEKQSGGIYHVLHAELPWMMKVTDEDLANEERLMEIATIQADDGDTILWGRFMFLPTYRQVIDDHYKKKLQRFAALQKLDRFFDELSPIYSGHTIVRECVQFFGQTNLDTCAYGSYGKPGGYGYAPRPPDEWCGLTVTEPETGLFWLVNDREFKKIQPVIIS